MQQCFVNPANRILKRPVRECRFSHSTGCAIPVFRNGWTLQDASDPFIGEIFLTCPQGGMKAVVWTDLFQGAVMLAGVLTVLIAVRT